MSWLDSWSIPRRSKSDRFVTSRSVPTLRSTQGPCVPNTHDPIGPDRGERVTVRAECDTKDCLAMTAEIKDLLSRHCVPESQSPVVPCCEDAPAIGAEGQVQHLAAVDVQRAVGLPGREVPEDTRSITHRGQPQVVWAKRKPGDPTPA